MAGAVSRCISGGMAWTLTRGVHEALPEHFESAVNGDREKAAHFAAQQVAAGGVFHVAASRTTKNSDDENALENKAFQAVEENNEETKNRGDTIRTCGLYVPNVAL